MHLKARSKLLGRHVHTTYFVAENPEVGAYQNIGTLVTEIGEWQVIGAALRLGAERTNGHLVVITEGDEEVVRLGSERLRWLDQSPEQGGQG
jgi:hypothetical protein